MPIQVIEILQLGTLAVPIVVKNTHNIARHSNMKRTSKVASFEAPRQKIKDEWVF